MTASAYKLRGYVIFLAVIKEFNYAGNLSTTPQFAIDAHVLLTTLRHVIVGIGLMYHNDR